jgi:hypothetical protein
MERVHPMNFSEFEERRRFQEAWEAVRIARNVHYSLFTFGESELPYFLVCEAPAAKQTVTITRGDVRITRPLIITPDNIHPELRNFFENDEQGMLVDFILRRTAAFSHLTFENQHGPARIVTDSVEEAVSRLNRQLDSEEEDRVAILCSPPNLAGFAVFRYAAERVMKSAPENVQELRERGLLP